MSSWSPNASSFYFVGRSSADSLYNDIQVSIYRERDFLSQWLLKLPSNILPAFTALLLSALQLNLGSLLDFAVSRTGCLENVDPANGNCTVYRC
jgi:hypothetical protein